MLWAGLARVLLLGGALGAAVGTSNTGATPGSHLDADDPNAAWGSTTLTVYDCEYKLTDAQCARCAGDPTLEDTPWHDIKQASCISEPTGCCRSDDGFEYFRKDSLVNYHVGYPTSYFFPGVDGAEIRFVRPTDGIPQVTESPGRCVWQEDFSVEIARCKVLPAPPPPAGAASHSEGGPPGRLCFHVLAGETVWGELLARPLPQWWASTARSSTARGGARPELVPGQLRLYDAGDLALWARLGPAGRRWMLSTPALQGRPRIYTPPKLFLHRLLPDHVRQVMVLDTDMYVMDDLCGLMDETAARFARPEHSRAVMAYAHEQQNEYRYQAMYPAEQPPPPQLWYNGFNGGLGILRLDRLREPSSEFHPLLEQMRRLWQSEPDVKPGSKGWAHWDLGDQTILTQGLVHHADSWRTLMLALPCRWNFQMALYWHTVGTFPSPQFDSTCHEPPSLLHCNEGYAKPICAAMHRLEAGWPRAAITTAGRWQWQQLRSGPRGARSSAHALLLGFFQSYGTLEYCRRAEIASRIRISRRACNASFLLQRHEQQQRVLKGARLRSRHGTPTGRLHTATTAR